MIGKTKRTGEKGKEKVYGFIDAALYELSKKAISEHEGILTESQKQEMLQKYFTTENIQNSYFMNSFKKTYKYVSEIRPYSYQKNEKKLREIVTETIIPSPVYRRRKIYSNLGVHSKAKTSRSFCYTATEIKKPDYEVYR